jgi:hypothetical protein
MCPCKCNMFYFSNVAEMTEVCKACGFGGHLLCCDTCPLLFHTECVVPPLKKVPRGKWSCPKCKEVKGEQYCVILTVREMGRDIFQVTEIRALKILYGV